VRDTQLLKELLHSITLWLSVNSKIKNLVREVLSLSADLYRAMVQKLQIALYPSAYAV